MNNGCASHAFFSVDIRMGMICDVEADGVTILTSDEKRLLTTSAHYVLSHYIGYKTYMMWDYDCTAIDCEYAPCTVKQNIDYTFSDEAIPIIPVYEKLPVLTEKLPHGGIFFDFRTKITDTCRRNF